MGTSSSKQKEGKAKKGDPAASPKKKKSASQKPAGLGSWQSPITSSFITEKAVRLSAPFLRPDGTLFWLEGRPDEGGRAVLVMRSADGASVQDVTPPPPPLTDAAGDAAAAAPVAPAPPAFNVRTTIHEYGGGEYLVVGDTVYFTNFRDQAIYAQTLSGSGGAASAPVLVTEGSAARGERFGDACWDGARGRLVAVSEVHLDASGAELPPERVVNRIVAVDVTNGAVTPLAEGGADFYVRPAVSPNGQWLAWVQWDFPNMPWDRTSLMVAPLQPDGTTGEPHGLAGGASAVQQPVWSPDGRYLYYVDDASSGWWNLYRCRTPAEGEGPVAWGGARAEAVWRQEADWGFPPWTLGLRSFEVLPCGAVLAVFNDPATAGASLALLTPPPAEGGGGGAWALTRINAGLSHFGTPALTVRASPDGGPVAVATVGASPTAAAAVVLLAAPSAAALAATAPGDWAVVRSSATSQIPDGYLSAPEVVAFPTTFNGAPATAHMLYYPPTNKDFCLPPGVLPPLLVKSHGGPTSSAATALNPLLQYWTSRGFAVADVDYGGSTGYGREYRERLKGRWGEVDVADCSAAAEWAVAAGRVDGRRLCISGGSAGGYTTLACLAFRRTFSAGASLYGVADLALLAAHTHKFESRYLDSLVGPLPKAAAVYDARSPLRHAADFAAPVIFFQGDEDKVVPPEQAVAMHAALKAAGLPTALVMLAGEQHGFRQALSIRTALDGELYFYGAVLGFPAPLPDDLPRIPIDNLPPSK